MRARTTVWTSVCAALAIATGCAGESEPDPGGDSGEPAALPPWYEDGMAGGGLARPKVIYPLKRGVSAPLRQMVPKAPKATPPYSRERPQPPYKQATSSIAPGSDAVRQAEALLAPDPLLSFDGLSNDANDQVLGFRVFPPDVNGDVGPNHYVQWNNLTFGVFDKAGNLMGGPFPGNMPWQGFGGECEAHNDGDPIVLYDQLADRWVFSQFAIFAPDGGHQCFAISQTGDPLGPYFLYDFLVSPGGAFNDYPKISVWPDGYYISFNEFNPNFTNAVTVAVDRESMIQGLPAAMVRFDVSIPNADAFTLQPAHLEGRLLPPDGAPGFYVMAFDDETWSLTPDPTTDFYNLWALRADWDDPGSSVFVGPNMIPTPEFDANMCEFSRSCIPQPAGGEGLDSLAQMTMYRLAYRNFSDHESMVVTHTTDVGGDLAGVRWAELRNPNSAPELFQTGTFAPADGLHRWMPAIAMDGQGNIAVGYSVGNADTFPGLRYAARLVSDPPGEMGQGEAVIVNGSGVQNSGFNRWGDYFSMSVDESDDCTFWFTGEYGSSATPNDWSTRIASMTMPLCTATEIGTIAGLVRRGNGNPLPGALVSAGAFSAVSGPDGTYSLLVPAGTHDVTASAFGFGSQTVTGVTVGDGETATANFRLSAAPRVRVSGLVTDDAEAGYGLYAELTFSASGTTPIRVLTDPVTGRYAIRLPSGEDFEVTVRSIVPGYLEETRPITPGPGDVVADFGLEVNTGTCNAPGYNLGVTLEATENFDGAFPPAGWTVENATTGCGGVPDWTNTDPGLRSNLTGGSAGFAVADSDQCGSEVAMDTTMTSPPIDLSGLTDADGLQISFSQDLFVFTPTGTLATVEVWDGAVWQVVSTQQSDSRGQRVSIGTKLANGVADARVRFRYLAGFEWWWQIDDVELSIASCTFQEGGGLVFGTITDRNTGLGINGATVTATGQPPVTTFATPNDPALKDGLYFTFLAAPGQITAAADGYQTRTVNVTPVPDGVFRRDLNLGAGIISAQPTELSLRVPFRGTASTTLTLVNTGTAPATVEINELEGPPSNITIGPFWPAGRRVGPRNMFELKGDHVRPHDIPSARPLAAGDAVRRIPTGLALPWGAGYDASTLSAWITNPGVGGGDDLAHRFLDDGTATGDTLDLSSLVAWSADMAYDSLNNKLWVVNVGGDNCIHELDPATRAITGNTICPAFGTSERGLAYDPVTDTFYAGSWNDARIVQFDRSGTILRAVQTELSISGLAYNPGTGHLFVAVNDAAAVPDVFVFDTAGDLTLIGQFEITDGGTPVFPDFSGAGLELDCAGNLWAVNQVSGEIVVAESNEPPACDLDVPWIGTSPETVTVPAGGSVAVTVSVDASTLTPGLREAQLLLRTDTPYDVPAVALHVTVAFNDVPQGSPGDAEIHGLAGADVSFGCGGGNFCPAEDLTRAVFAVWGLRSAFGTEYVPPRATGLPFDDLSPKEFGSDFAEDAVARGLIDGCGPRLYCPDAALTRGEAAVYVLRLLFGAEYEPPPATGTFGDVPADIAPFVEDAVGRGIFEPCGAGAFCPGDGIDRAGGAVFLVRAFGFNI
jgi:hypothetical protein